MRDSVFPQHPLVRRPWFIRLAIDDAGQDLIEYAAIGALVGVVVIVAASALGGSLNRTYERTAIGAEFGSIGPGGSGADVKCDQPSQTQTDDRHCR